MKRYLQVFAALFRASAIAELEYRVNITVKIFSDIIWYLTQLSIFAVIYRHTNTISGWTYENTRVFMCLLFIVDSVYMLLLHDNLDRFSEKVRKGEIDLVLAKPINSQFMLTFHKVHVAYLGNIVVTVGMLIYALEALPTPIEWTRLLLLFILIPCGVAITYGIRFIFSASALIFTNADNINYLWFQFYKLGMRPDAIYPPWLRWMILTVVPVGFIASVPARLILEAPDLLLLAASIGFAAVSVYLSTRFWRFALRFYSSASS